MQKLGVGILLVVASGCATTGPMAEPPVIPVYKYPEAVPGRFENIQGLHRRMTVTVRSGDHYNSIRDRELAKLGAEIGADAVVLAEPPEYRPLTINIETPMTAIFDGTAIRYLEHPCGIPPGGGE